MKDLIFVTWLYLQILLVQCDIFDNNLNGSDSDHRIKMCIQKTINHLFSQNDTLNLILNSDLCEDAIFEMNTTRPYIVLNMDATHDDVNKLQYDGQFIICPKDGRSLQHTIHSVRHIALKNMRTMGNSKCLVITNITDVSKIFRMFWWYGINNLIILLYGQGKPKLVTGNRYAPENECGKTAKLIMDQDCEEQLSPSFTNVIHQMNKCPITLKFTYGFIFENEKHPFALAVHHVLIELSQHLNATFQRAPIIGVTKYDDLLSSVANIIILYTQEAQKHYWSTTEPLARTEPIWMVPKAKQISNMNACVKVFNYDVWIATSVVFICAVLIWLLTISRNGGFTFDKLSLSFLNVWSLTICGNVARIPKSLALRILLLFYLIYVIHIQCAFTSDMSTVLTAPQYAFQIRNLEELVDSKLPIYTNRGCKNAHFHKNKTDQKLYTKLQNSIHVETDNQYVNRLLNLHLHGNYAVIAVLEEIRDVEILYNKKIEAYQIRDNFITDAYTIRFDLIADHYFTTTLNTFISRMVESGMQDKHTNDIYHHYYHTEKVAAMPEDDAISLKHLVFIFIFLGLGLCTACVVFCFELVLNKYL